MLGKISNLAGPQQTTMPNAETGHRTRGAAGCDIRLHEAVSVGGPKPVTAAGGVPTDPDCGGRFEDVNGDGEADVVDTQALFANRDSNAVQSETFAFNFSDAPEGDGEVNVVDVQALFTETTG